MLARPPFSSLELTAALDERQLLVLRLLHFALPLGPILFLGAVLVVSANPPQGSEAPGLPLLLSAVTAALTIGCWVVGLRAHAAILTRAAVEARGVTDLLAPLRTASVLRLALLEAPALFGVVVLLIAGLDGSLRTQPLLMGNALPAFALAAFAVMRWPRRESAVEDLLAADARAAR